MKKTQIFTIACALFAVFSIVQLLHRPRQLQIVPTLQTEEIPSGYLIKLHDGHIAVFDAGNPDTPIRLTNIPASSLRHYDRELLAVGIPVSTEEELLMRLEDFGS